MPSLKDLKNKIASVKNTRKITKAMQMVSAAKLRRAQDAAEAARPYAERMSAVMAGLASGVGKSASAPRLLAGNGQDKVHLLVVIYSLGRGDLLGGLGPFRDAWRRGDLQAAAHVAERDLRVTADSGEQLLENVQRHLLWQAYQSFYAVIFWYFLLGPVAVLSYRLLALAQEHSQNPALVERAGQLRHAFDWLPVRLLAASFALVGNFAAVSRVMLHELLSWDISAAQLINKAGCAAAEIPAPQAGPEGVSSLDTLWALLLRAAVLWYACFAVWALLL